MNTKNLISRKVFAAALPVVLLALLLAGVGSPMLRSASHPEIQFTLETTTASSASTSSPRTLFSSPLITTSLTGVLTGVGSGAVAVNPVTNLVYVANPSGHTVSVIDASTNTVIDTVRGGTQPDGIAVNPITNMVYIADFGPTVAGFGIGKSVIAMDGSTDTIIANITVGWAPEGIGVDPNTNMVYVANNAQNTVSVIDGLTNSVANTITVDWYPNSIAVNPNTNLIYAVSGWDDAVSVISGTAIAAPNIGVGNLPAGVAINPNTNRIYVTNARQPQGNSVTVIDGTVNLATTINGVLNPIAVGPSPTGIGVDPNTNMIYVANNDGTISMINALTNVNLGNFQLGGGSAHSVAVNSDTDTVYVSTNNGNVYALHAIVGDVNGDCKVSVVDLATVALAYGSKPGSPNWNPNADVTGDGIVNIIDLATVAINYGQVCM